ncbi:MAG: TlpA family protein disulfide reductase [Planctomycetia bacterium]|nr:TlpA family protein disulfide reductase [Planctomycetia bacterium]
MNRHLFKYAGFIFLFVITILITSRVSYAADDIKNINLKELNSLLDGNKGKVVVVDLWASWCPPCKKEIPGFINLYKKYKDKGVEIIGVALDENGSETVPPFVKKTGINYPVYLGGNDIASQYSLNAYPTTIIYSKNGKIANKHVGYVSEEEFDEELSKLLENKTR